MWSWLDSLRTDAVFGWRQLAKKKVASAAAVLSLALAIGACTSAFRLIDALLWRPLPIAEPERLYSVAHEFTDDDGKTRTGEGTAYPQFRQMRAAVKGQAELIAVSFADRVDLTYGSDQEMEKARQQYVSGWMFSAFGLRPALGRLFTERDDLQPGAHPYAVLSHDYWQRRFARDPAVIGRKFRVGNDLYEIVGVAEASFTGTETGTMIDIFVPTMMKGRAVNRPDYFWHRTLVRLEPGVAPEPIRQRLHAVFRASREEQAKGFKAMPARRLEQFLNQTLLLEPAASGVSGVQKANRRSLASLAVLAALVLLIACVNVANLMTAQAVARAREMALRVSIGAGRWRLVQLVLLESAWLAFLAAAAGGIFAWWSAPFVVSMIGAQLALPVDWRLFAFGVLLSLSVTLLFGLAPALRASAVKPVSALKGGDDPRSRRRWMHGLVAVQVALCFVVIFDAGLFVTTFDRLANQPLGFSSKGILNVETVASTPQPGLFWEQVAEHLRALPGVETVALTEWPLMQGGVWSGLISTGGATPSVVLSNFMAVSPGWMNTMKIPLIQGRDFTSSDSASLAIVNRAFAKEYFGGENPIGKSFQISGDGKDRRIQIVGLVADARYHSARAPMEPIAYFPFRLEYTRGTFVIRTTSPDPLMLAPILPREIPRARPGFLVSNVRTQTEVNEAQTVRERLLAMLAIFFGAVALLLGGVGLYGVLDYSALQRRREIGIRVALGAQAADIARRVTSEIFSMVAGGALAGVILGIESGRRAEALLYQTSPTETGVLMLPALTIGVAASLAALPAVVRAVRIDPVKMLRAD